jgi:hypothetical protein
MVVSSGVTRTGHSRQAIRGFPAEIPGSPCSGGCRQNRREGQSQPRTTGPTPRPLNDSRRRREEGSGGAEPREPLSHIEVWISYRLCSVGSNGVWCQQRPRQLGSQAFSEYPQRGTAGAPD